MGMHVTAMEASLKLMIRRIGAFGVNGSRKNESALNRFLCSGYGEYVAVAYSRFTVSFLCTLRPVSALC